jgi:hypothetical protein
VSALGCCDVASRSLGREINAARARDGDAPRTRLAHHGLATAAWIVPGAILALLPKCPACLAAYVAIWTGAGLSISTAAHERMLLVIVCVASLAFLAARCARRLVG